MKTKNTELVNAAEFGIEVEKAIMIQKSFIPKISETEGYEEVYKKIISTEISEELASEASELRKKLVKVRTGISDIHKVEKQFYLQAGRFVDALKNKLTLPVSQMEEKLSEIEKFYENQEKERLQKLQDKRVSLISKYVEDAENLRLSEMESDVFDAYLTAKKKAFEDKIEAEKQAELDRMEIERTNKLHKERYEKLLPFWSFVPDGFKSLNMGMAIEMEFNSIFEEVKEAKKEYEVAQEKIRLENERLKKEADAKEKALEVERHKAKLETEKLEAKRQAELKSEREKQAKLEAELKARKDAEIKAENDKKLSDDKAKLEAENLAKAPVKKQLKSWVDSFSIPDTSVKNETSAEIKAKFEAFKLWAGKTIDKL